MKWWLVDFRRGVTERSFLGAILIGTLGMGIGLAYYFYTQRTYTGTDAFIGSQSLILPFIAPLLASMVYSNMNMLEKDCGYKSLLMLKNHGKDYVLKRWFINNCLSGLALVIPVFLFFVICTFISPYTNQQQIIGVLLLDFLFGFVYGSFAYSLTFVNSKRYIPLVVPEVLYLLFIYAFPYLNLEKFYPPLSFSPWLMPMDAEVYFISLQLVILFGVSILIILGGWLFRKGEVLWLQRK